MEDDPTVDLVAVACRPAAARASLHLVVPLEGELDGGLRVAIGRAGVERAMDVAEVEFAGPVLVEPDEALPLGVDERLVPHLHPRDPPAADEGGPRLTAGARLLAA